MAQSGKEIHHDERYTDIHNRDNSYNSYRYNDCSRNRCEDRKRRKSITTALGGIIMAKKNTGFLDILVGVCEGLAEVGVNSYTVEEKEMIKAVRRIMSVHGKTKAVEELDKVIKDMDLGITRRS